MPAPKPQEFYVVMRVYSRSGKDANAPDQPTTEECLTRLLCGLLAGAAGDHGDVRIKEVKLGYVIDVAEMSKKEAKSETTGRSEDNGIGAV